MSLADALTKKRFGGHGLLLFPLLLMLMLVPLWKLSRFDHPLASVERVQLCPLLPSPPLPLGKVVPGPLQNPHDMGCVYRDELGREVLTHSIQTTRQLSTEAREAVDTERWFETWRKEIPANQGNWRDVPGKWKHGGAWRDHERESVLFEDAGVLVWISSERLDADRLARYAESVRASLRGERAK